MSEIGEIFDLVAKGGAIMLPIFALSLYTFYVATLKIMQFRAAEISEQKFISLAIENLQTGKIDEAENNLKAETSPVAKVMLAALELVRHNKLPQKRIEPEIERVGLTELAKLKMHLRGLEVVAAVAPLLGLLGTVIGMVKAFAKLAENTARVDPSILAGGIWEALITTVAGLLVAIAAFLAYHYFTSKVDNTRMLMKDSVTQILNLQEEEKPYSELPEILKRVRKIEKDAKKEEAG